MENEIMSAKEYWKKDFGEYPQNVHEKLAVVMMTSYREYITSFILKECVTKGSTNVTPN